MTTQPTPNPKSDFMAAEEIKSILDGRELAEQERIIRWVGESLGLTLHLRHKAPSALPESSEPVSPPPALEDRATDIRSFIQQKQPKGDIQFAAAVAYYHRFVANERKDAITTSDLQEGARHANRAVFKTPSATLNNAVQQGYLDRAGRGVYKLNAVGENLVSMTLPSSEGTGTPKGTRRKPAKKKTTGAARARRRRRN